MLAFPCTSLEQTLRTYEPGLENLIGVGFFGIELVDSDFEDSRPASQNRRWATCAIRQRWSQDCYKPN